MSTNKEIFIFIGPPGSGKGSLSQCCIENLGWTQLSTGFLCRKHITEQTEIGKQIDFAIKSGKLIEDKLIIDMVEDWLIHNADQFNCIILDGFPRTILQAKALNELLQEKLSYCNVHIVHFRISDNEVIRRLSGRFICKNNDCQAVYSIFENSDLSPKDDKACDHCSSPLVRREDDKPETVKGRLKAYYTHEKNIIDFYKEGGQVINTVDVEKPLENVFLDLKEIVNKKLMQ